MFGIDAASTLSDGAFLSAAAIALWSGILSFLSPCVLPIVPPYLAYIGGVSVSELRGGRARALLPAAFFVLGLSTVFLFLGFAASSLGRLVLGHRETLSLISGLVVIGLGLHFVGLYRIPLLDREARLDVGTKGGTALGAYVLGLAFAFGWTPCIGPQLGMILSLAATAGDTTRGTALLGIYALGLGLPFLLAAAFISRAMTLMTRLKPHMRLIERVMGVLLILVGLALATGGMSAFSFWLLETFPALAAWG
ncbi:cytochrome c biogenesis CcdA family protein [Phaeovulum vinaykumarii]|uniref:Cytochrome c-type biogenesis protein n=1 Tax=Phaeovulum vinaykumarii TaxID=407234 RepID=A0A1N7M759_9RHOB|nr:cytochrome c biogenesis protein CcdA [Phaeovulum vinaykumarii]SIS81918.1 cytochrome c-type biogenesis protein [Phaeovulum vinaykumarii]SOC11297.1 cytochrome c biogenesis protein CcdA [Phaeovulum vinaykumarii]